MPSMAMLTTPERSDHSPAMAPRAIGVPRRSDSTISWTTLVDGASDHASERMTTSGASSTADTIRPARA